VRLRLLSVFSVVLALTAMGAAPATPGAKGCGAPGYAYAGMVKLTPAHGIAARVTALAEPIVEKGHVAAWIGVGGPGQGPNDTDEWLQVGLNKRAGNSGALYYEIATAGAVKYVGLDQNVPARRQYRVAVLEVAGRPNVWRVWVDGRPVSKPIYLPASHESLTPMALGESWDGGRTACNRYAYRFRRIALAAAPGGSWQGLRTANLTQDPGYRAVRSRDSGFTVLTEPPVATDAS
jgi:hypothetical protein